MRTILLIIEEQKVAQYFTSRIKVKYFIISPKYSMEVNHVGCTNSVKNRFVFFTTQETNCYFTLLSYVIITVS
jgi:hypothetical protein